jgi:hypothetical protein
MTFVRCAVLVALATSLLLGCGGGEGKTMIPAVDDPDCTNNSASIGFKTPAGYTASMDLFTTSNCFAQATYSTRAGTTVLAGPPFTGEGLSPDPTLKVWLYLSYQFDTLEYLDGLPDVNVHVPAEIVVPGRNFYLAYGNNESGRFTWDPDPDYGTPARYTTVDFGFVQWPAPPVNIEPNAFYQFALYSLDGGTPSSRSRQVPAARHRAALPNRRLTDVSR